MKETLRPTVEARKQAVDNHGEVLLSLSPFVEGKLGLLRPVENIWQPSDLLPDLKQENWQERLDQFRHEMADISNNVFIVLAGHAVTEEALPPYQTWQQRITSVSDKSGIDDTPWARWTRGWTAEENRHGELLTATLRYSGRVNMRAYEKSIQSLIRNGFNPDRTLVPQVGPDPYQAFMYTSFQEEATQVSHSNIARVAREQGSEYLYKMSAMMAGDEGRHKIFYQDVMGEVFKIDPEEAVVAFRDMIKKQVVMPGGLMTNGEPASDTRQTDLFEDFAKVAIGLGVYTPEDYVGILEGLTIKWGIEKLPVSAESAIIAQADIFRLLALYKRSLSRKPKSEQPEYVSIPWVDEPVKVNS